MVVHNKIIKVMPRKNTIRQNVEGGFYHIYNRGVDKRIIFEEEIDYIVFMRFLKEYLLPPDHPDLDTLRGLDPRRIPINCHEQVELLAYCLMPNHFHLFIKQLKNGGISNFMQALATNYSVYFNHRNKRVGPLYQGPFKAVLVRDEPYFIYISKYIHRNPLSSLARVKPSHAQELADYSYSSYPDYLGKRRADWLNPSIILEMFKDSKDNLGVSSYQKFVEQKDIKDSNNLEGMSWLLLDEE
jgi:REP element-mobilizing transposase RayT